MKVYVDELSKNCEDCYFYKNNHCLFDTADCPFDKNIITFDSLTDYTKQVIKKVAQEIKEKLNNLKPPPNYPEFDCEYGFDNCLYQVEDILDQIGENKR